MRVNFATGVVVGVLLASLAVVVSSGYSGPSSLGSFAPVRQTVQFTSTSTAVITASATRTATATTTSAVTSSSTSTTTTAATTTSSATAATGVLIPGPLSNLTGSVSTLTTPSTTTSQFGATVSSTPSGRPPSNLAVIVGNPSQSLLLLLPIALAVVLGLAFYRSSSSAD